MSFDSKLTFDPTRARQLAPRALLDRQAEKRLEHYLTDDRARVQAHQHMEFLLGASQPGADIDAVAEAFMHVMARRASSRWQVKKVTSQPVDGVEAATRMQRKGGSVLCFAHHGQYDGIAGSIHRTGLDVTAVIDDGTAATTWGRQHLRLIRRGGELFPARLGSKAILDVVASGKMAGLAVDVPGRTPVRFAERDVFGSFGAARLAYEAAVPVLLCTTHRGDHGEPRLLLHEPVEARDFADAQELLVHIMAVHEKAILEWPEFYDAPLYRWKLADDDPDAARFTLDGPGVF